jgi:hypothetical protein
MRADRFQALRVRTGRSEEINAQLAAVRRATQSLGALARRIPPG